MAASNPPFVAQGRTDHPAVLFRMMLAGIASAPGAAGITSPLGGVNPTLGSGLAVSGLASMNVTVGTGLGYVPSTTAWNGTYAVYQSTTTNVAIAAASSTQWRRDYIVAQVTDPGDNTAAWTPAAVTGAFSSSAPGALPAIPANAIPLAIINVTPNMTVTNGGGTVQDARLFLPLPGIWPTTSSARPPLTAPEGTMWFETDTNQAGIIINGAYVYFSLATSVADTWHDLRPASAGWSGSVSGEYPPQYRKSPDGTRVEIFGIINLSNPYTGVNVFANPLPAGYRPNHTVRIPFFTLSNGTSNMVSTGLAQVLTNGNIQFSNLPTGLAGTNIFFNGSFPLDASGLIQS
jgi:hypothetical protein